MFWKCFENGHFAHLSLTITWLVRGLGSNFKTTLSYATNRHLPMCHVSSKAIWSHFNTRKNADFNSTMSTHHYIDIVNSTLQQISAGESLSEPPPRRNTFSPNFWRPLSVVTGQWACAPLPNSFLFLVVTVPLHLHIMPLSLPCGPFSAVMGPFYPCSPVGGLGGGLRRLWFIAQTGGKTLSH